MDFNIPDFESISDELYDEAIINLFDFDFEAIFSYQIESLHLSDQLAGLRKKDLTWIRRHLKVENVSTLNKDQLREALVEKIPRYLEKTLKYFSKSNYELLNYFIETELQYFMLENYDLQEIEVGAYCFSYGIAFPAITEEGLHFFFPDATYNLLRKKLQNKEIAKAAEKNEEIILTTWSLLHFYGAASFHDLYEMLENYMKVDFSFDFYYRLLEVNSGFHNSFQLAGGSISLKDVYHPDELYSEQLKRNFDYAVIPKHEFEKVRKEEAHVFNFAQKRLAKYLKQSFEMSREEADNITYYIYHLIQNGIALREIFEELRDILLFESAEDISELMELVTDVNNQTRLWALRGHRPEEIGI